MVFALYFTNWCIYGREFTPNKMPIEKLTHIIYAFAKTDPNTGTVSLSDPWADTDKKMDGGGQGCIGELQLLKQQRNPNLRVLLSIGGWTYSPDLTQAFATPEKMAEFVRSSTELMFKHKFDGIDVDWEYPDTPEKCDQFVKLLSSLRQTIGPDHELTIAAPSNPDIIQRMPLREIDRYLNFWNIMTYDFSGAWSPVATHHANLYGGSTSVDSVISQYINNGVPPSKIVLGLPVYGRSFAKTKGFGYPFNGTIAGKFEQGVHDIKELPLPQTQENVDTQIGAAYCQGPDFVVTYDNAYVAMMKADYAKSRQLAGGMWWEASEDRPDQHSVVNAFIDRFSH